MRLEGKARMCQRVVVLGRPAYRGAGFTSPAYSMTQMTYTYLDTAS